MCFCIRKESLVVLLGTSDSELKDQSAESIEVEMLASPDGVQAESFHIFQDDKFIPRRMTRELAIDTYSSSAPECYHAGACATVPFIWESQPGTPKHRLGQTPLPPLTPPPSFFSSPATTPSTKKHSTRKFVFPNFSFIRNHHHHHHHRAVRLSTSSETSQSLSSPSSWSSSSATALSSPVTPLCDYYYSRRYGFNFEVAEESNYFRSSSYGCSTFLCFSSQKCSRRNNAKAATRVFSKG